MGAADRGIRLPLSMDKQPQRNDSYLNLVTANMLRLRRQFDLAEAQCGEVLRREPRNAAAHSVMGDIARDRGKLEDAIEWYKLALDIDPGNLSDRRKLEAVIDELYPRDRPGPVARVSQQLSRQSEAVATEMRSARLPPIAYLALGAMLAVIVGVTVVVLALGHRAGSPTPGIGDEQPSGAFVPIPLQPQQTAETTSAESAPPRFVEQIDALERALLDYLTGSARVVDPNCRVADAELDPRDGAVSVRISMPRVWSADTMRDGVLRVAAALARAAAAWDERVSSVRVRCDMRQEGEPDEHAFLGEADAAAIPSAPENPTPTDNAKVFSSVWWTAELASTGQPAPAGVGQ